ncbi:MAG: DUF4397 domain-containing protein [Bacteroidetes bacterium]|nr:DUF4397 domain-containing protein [Bacteroidota bacterium]
MNKSKVRQTLMNKKILKYSLLLFLIAVIGCIDENPDLLNPPPQSATMYVRFINLAAADKLKLSLNGAVESGLTEYAACSDTLHPPADSAIAAITLEDSTIYKKKNKVRFILNTYYSLFALPPAPSDSTYPNNKVDSIISIGTISSFTGRYNTAYIKVLNANPDTTYRFSVILGCPNGKPIVQNLRYRSVGTPIELPAGNEAISVLTETFGNTPDINLYKLHFDAGGQYTIIIYRLNSGKPDLLLLDEFGGLKALSEVDSVPKNEKFANVRTINFSSQPVTVKKMPDETVATDVLADYITSYSNITACGSQSSDTFTSLIGSEEKSYASVSLEVLKNFTIAVFDSANFPAKLTIAIPPVRLGEPLNGRAAIRVINSSVNYPGFTLSVGAMDDNKSSTGFRSGELISPAIKYGEISQFVMIPSGFVPLSVYTTEDPTRLIYNTLTEMKPDKNYLIFILDDPSNPGKIKLSLVEENDVGKSPAYLTEGAFTQVVHLLPDAETITVAIPPVLSKAMLYLSGSLATVMNGGNANITISGSQLNINVDVAKRNLIIATGNSQSKDLLVFQYSPLTIEKDNYKRRFINACKEFPAVHVALNCDTCFIARDIQYGSASPLDVVTLERTSSFMFVNPADSTVIKRIDGLSLPFGKNFTFILGGNKTAGYTIVQQQEF